MRAAYNRSGETGAAVVAGLAGTARVITAAAAIMIAVFAAFVPSTDVAVKVIGVGMASAILIDATAVRLLLVPAVMHLLGRWNWWIPAALDRRLPHLAVEGHEEAYLPTAALTGDVVDGRPTVIGRGWRTSSSWSTPTAPSLVPLELARDDAVPGTGGRDLRGQAAAARVAGSGRAGGD
jgi:hypothetical protein